MAKGNLFLGMGRGKVGDVVFYRMNGLQMARVRNRTPKNPRTNEQLYQRAVIASVMKAYSAGKEIFDHSFQGYTVGEGCMRRFNSVNARILRAALFDDINKGIAENEQRGRFCAPGSVTCTPIIGLQVSEGTLTNTLFEPNYTNELVDYKTPNITANTVNDYLGALGVSAGDIFTFVYLVADYKYPVYVNPWSDSQYANQYQTKFGWCRFIVKDNISDELTMANATWGAIFRVETGGELLMRFGLQTPFQANTSVPITLGATTYGATCACIRSRQDVDLRSTAYMLPYHDSKFGIVSEWLLDVWSDEVLKIGQSELILEGGNAGDGVTGGYTGNEGGQTGPGGPGGLPVEDRAITPITNSPQNMKGARKTARHRGSMNETEG